MAPGCRLLFSHFSSFQSSFPVLCPLLPLRLSLERQLGHPIVQGWPLAGGWRHAALVPRSQAVSPGCGRAAQLTWSSDNAFSPLCFSGFFLSSLLSEELFSSGIPSQPHPAAGVLLEGEERRAEGTWNAIACHPTMLSLTCPFLQQGLGWALPADPIV